MNADQAHNVRSSSGLTAIVVVQLAISICLHAFYFNLLLYFIAKRLWSCVSRNGRCIKSFTMTMMTERRENDRKLCWTRQRNATVSKPRTLCSWLRCSSQNDYGRNPTNRHKFHNMAYKWRRFAHVKFTRDVTICCISVQTFVRFVTI